VLKAPASACFAKQPLCFDDLIAAAAHLVLFFEKNFSFNHLLIGFLVYG
jgi:hypothetical protein